MKWCILFEFAGPSRLPKFEKAGKVRRFMFLWFSVVVFPYSWTEFLKRYRIAAEEMLRDDHTDLIRHMQIHAGYAKCGYVQMTTEQKQLFDRLNVANN